MVAFPSKKMTASSLRIPSTTNSNLMLHIRINSIQEAILVTALTHPVALLTMWWWSLQSLTLSALVLDCGAHPETDASAALQKSKHGAGPMQSLTTLPQLVIVCQHVQMRA